MPPRPLVPPTVSRRLRTSPRPTSPRAASRRSVCTSFRPAFPRPTSHCQPQPASRHAVGRRSAEMWAALGGAGGLHVGLLLGGARGLHSSPVFCGKNLLKKFASKTKYCYPSGGGGSGDGGPGWGLRGWEAWRGGGVRGREARRGGGFAGGRLGGAGGSAGGRLGGVGAPRAGSSAGRGAPWAGGSAGRGVRGRGAPWSGRLRGRGVRRGSTADALAGARAPSRVSKRSRCLLG